ncbi:glutathione S-transferase family protein [Azospirillum sp. 412522]|nr:glutathione S-transferase family protein [Azospirillum sp. 412522]MBY6263371.1 glutathione S-transferase family protein [Azospirillum sp. 412522]
MILIGQYDSPFVRRVAVALRLYGMAYEHRPWSVFSDAAEVARFNPLKRVPTLVLADGEVLIESGAILDHLDEVAGPDRALIARQGPDRRRALKLCALSTGLADKAVSLVYERVLHKERSELWVERCTGQIGAVLDALEADRAAAPGPWWFGDRIGHADIAAGCALRFVGEAHPGVFDRSRWPTLAAHSGACEAMAEFQAVVQPFSVNA